ncbi:MAG: NUDIX hydrolase [Acidobacteria bacterium]|nr:NUDIX hydrolase [Acidobacteriota bacterium]
MLRKILRKFWGIIPGGIRLKLIRATQKKFTVSVAAIITNQAGKVLLLEHLLRPQASGWGIPGGFINFGEQFEDAIRREIREETGIELDGLVMIRIRTLGRHVEVMFRARTSDTPQVLSREICSLGWFDVSEMPAGMSEVQKSLVRDVLADDTDGLLADLLEQTAAFGEKP